MIIKNLKTNRMTTPIGFDFGKPRLSWIAECDGAKKQEAAQIQVALDSKFSHIVFDTGISNEIDSIGLN